MSACPCSHPCLVLTSSHLLSWSGLYINIRMSKFSEGGWETILTVSPNFEKSLCLRFSLDIKCFDEISMVMVIQFSWLECWSEIYDKGKVKLSIICQHQRLLLLWKWNIFITLAPSCRASNLKITWEGAIIKYLQAGIITDAQLSYFLGKLTVNGVCNRWLKAV